MDDLVLRWQRQGIGRDEDVRRDVDLVAGDGHHVEVAPHRPDGRVALDDVDALDDGALGDALVLVPALDLDGAHDLDDGPPLRSFSDPGEDRQLVTGRDVVILAHLEVDLVVLAEQHLVLRAPGDASPDVLALVVDEGFVSEKHRGSRDPPTARGAHEGAVGAGASLALPAHPHVVARVDPVRVLDLRVVAPDLGPVPGAAQVVVG